MPKKAKNIFLLETFQESLRRLMKENYVKDSAELSRKTNIDPGSLSRYLNKNKPPEEGQLPDVERALALAAFFEVSVRELMTGEPDPKPESGEVVELARTVNSHLETFRAGIAEVLNQAQTNARGLEAMNQRVTEISTAYRGSIGAQEKRLGRQEKRLGEEVDRVGQRLLGIDERMTKAIEQNNARLSTLNSRHNVFCEAMLDLAGRLIDMGAASPHIPVLSRANALRGLLSRYKGRYEEGKRQRDQSN